MGDLIDGKASARTVRHELRARLAALRALAPTLTPHLAIVLVGDHAPSEIYVRNKLAACAKVGILATVHRLPATLSQAALDAHVTALSATPTVHALLVQLPLPPHLDARSTVACVDPDKDIDGLHPLNVGRLHSGIPGFIPCTPLGIMRLLADHDVALPGLHAVVLGRSAIVGRPMSWLLLRAHATVTTCHRHTPDPAALARTADLLVSAVGLPHLVTPAWVKPGAVVIDVGINRLPDGRIVGDCSTEVRDIARLSTPVPGGVGPMTVAMMLSNVVTAAERFAARAALR